MQIDKKTLKNIFIGVGACIVLYWILHETERFKSVFQFLKGVLSPFIIGACIGFIINVPMSGIEAKLTKVKKIGLRRTLALVITLAVVLLVLALVFVLLIPQVTATAESFAAQLPPFFQGVQTKIMEFLADNPEIMEWVKENTSFQSFDFGGIIDKVVDMLGDSVSAIIGGAFSAIGGIAGLAVNVIIGLVFAVYALFNKEILARQGRKLLYAYLPESWADNIIRVFRLTNTTFSNFLSGQCLEVCILGCMFAIGMAIFRMPYIPLVSVLVAVTAFIPVVGAFVGCIFGAFFILVDNPLQAVGFVVLFLVIQQIEGNVIYPRVVGNSIGLPGMWVLLAVALGGELMGVAGMFLMIPLTSVVYTLLREITNVRIQHRNIPEEKLLPQPPELNTHLKAKRLSFRAKFTEVKVSISKKLKKNKKK